MLFDLARAVLAIAVLVFLGWLLSTNRRAVPWRMVGWGVGLQVLLAVLVLGIQNSLHKRLFR